MEDETPKYWLGFDLSETWFCWNIKCQWSGPLSNANRKTTAGADEREVFHHVLCPICNEPLFGEAATERAGIREFDGNMTREEAENVSKS